LEQLVEKIEKEGFKVIIMGDFNKGVNKKYDKQNSRNKKEIRLTPTTRSTFQPVFQKLASLACCKRSTPTLFF